MDAQYCFGYPLPSSNELMFNEEVLSAAGVNGPKRCESVSDAEAAGMAALPHRAQAAGKGFIGLLLISWALCV